MRENGLQARALHARRWPNEKVHQVDDVARVVVQAAPALGLARPPGAVPLLDHHLSESAAVDVGHLPQSAGAHQPPCLLEGSDEAVVKADLVDAAVLHGEPRQGEALLRGEGERLLDEEVGSSLQGVLSAVVMGGGGGGDDDCIRTGLVHHLLVAGECLNADVLLQHREHVVRGVAHRHHRRAG